MHMLTRDKNEQRASTFLYVAEDDCEQFEDKN